MALTMRTELSTHTLSSWSWEEKGHVLWAEGSLYSLGQELG